MPSAIDEQTQYVDTSGAPLVGGKIYIGIVDLDPKLNSITIYSDRELTVVLANPQTLDANGRSTNKIWIPARYSIKIENVSGTQVYQELDNGESVSGGITSLGNVSGGDTITATAATTITAYVDKEIYTFKAAQINTGPVTLNIDSVGAKPFNKNFNKAILPGDFAANQNIAAQYNSTSDDFDWVNQKVQSVTFYEGSAVASVAGPNIWATDGDTIHITGTTTITSFTAAPNVGARKTLIFDDAVLLTHSANLRLPGGVNYTTEEGDEIDVGADTTTQFDVRIIPKDGLPIIPKGVVQAVNVTDSAVATGTGVMPEDDTIPQSSEGTEFMTLAITPLATANILRIEIVVNMSRSSDDTQIVALFQDSTANALAAVSSGQYSPDKPVNMSFTHWMAAGTTSSTTFRIRAGGENAGTTTFNGVGAGRIFGGVMSSSITITEIVL